MTCRLDILVPASKGPLAFLGDSDLAALDARLDSVDSMNEAEPGGKRASKATLTAGQAAVNAVINARRGKS